MNLTHAIENITTEEYLALCERGKHARGMNGEPSYYDQIERGYFQQPIEQHGVFINAVYRHHKGKEYVVTGIVADSETCELVVIYEALYDNHVSKGWARKLSSFIGSLEGGKTPRFVLKNSDAVVEAAKIK